MIGTSIEDKKFSLPDNIVEKLKIILNNNQNNKDSDGYKRINFLINNSNNISYNEMKRLKNFFDNYKGKHNDSIYILNGGDFLKNWVNYNLETTRENNLSSKKTHMNAGIDNSFTKEYTKDTVYKTSTPDFKSLYSESYKKCIDRINEINNKLEKK